MISNGKLVWGFGINDANYAVQPRRGSERIKWCPFYQSWQNMIQRCYSEKRHMMNPSYAGCHVCPEWKYFMTFRSWMASKDWQSMHLDKDVLFPGNKLYSPETCVFITSALNKFLCDAGAIRGEWPIGVCWAKRERKFLARCCDPFDNGKHKFLGYFDCPKAAHHAWRVAKHSHACRYADMQSDPRVADAIRKRYLVTKEGF